MKTIPLWLAALLTALLALAPHSRADAAPSDAPYRPNSFAQQVDQLARDGFEHPAESLAALRAMQGQHAGSPSEQRALLLAIGSIEARGARVGHAVAVADQLLEVSADDPAGLGVASSNLVRALIAEHAGQLDVAAALAQSALPAFHAGCPGGPPSPMQGMECQYRSAWLAMQMLERKASNQGLQVAAAAHARNALVLAEWAGDAGRCAINLTSLAIYAKDRGEQPLAQTLLGQAKRAAAQTENPATQARVLDTEAKLVEAQGDRKAALRLYDEALSLAIQAGATRLEAVLLTNISDTYAHLGRPAEALNTAERALVIARRHGDLRLERVLINNAGIAKIGLGRVAEGKHDLARSLELWQRGGETGRQVITLLEFGEALAAAGDARGALELYHQERALSDALMRANRTIALKELQTRNAAEARERDIELLGRDNALKTAAIANQDLLQRIWWLLAAVMVLAILLVTILYRRGCETHLKLEASRVRLQAQSERDPLTNLANRRHFQAVMAELCGAGGFDGALLLVDVDRFKHVNDAHGHAAGDQVLVEVGKRLNDAVRSGDLIVRWGGEEFLILAPHAAGDQAEQMAARVLCAIGQTPIKVGEADKVQALRVTASIGYASFPLGPHATEVRWERAVNLADMALYTAKNQGRNRAVGVAVSNVDSPGAWHRIEADFERAWRDGRLILLHTPGPWIETRGHPQAA